MSNALPKYYNRGLSLVQVPKAWREKLKGLHITTGRSKLHSSVTAADGTRKFLLQLHDGLIVETVGIPADDAERPRLTVCVSSQVGHTSLLMLVCPIDLVLSRTWMD